MLKSNSAKLANSRTMSTGGGGSGNRVVGVTAVASTVKGSFATTVSANGVSGSGSKSVVKFVPETASEFVPETKSAYGSRATAVFKTCAAEPFEETLVNF